MVLEIVQSVRNVKSVRPMDLTLINSDGILAMIIFLDPERNTYVA